MIWLGANRLVNNGLNNNKYQILNERPPPKIETEKTWKGDNDDRKTPSTAHANQINVHV